MGTAPPLLAACPLFAAALGGENAMKKLWDFGMSLFNRYKEVILYLIFGGLTTLVNIVSYALFVFESKSQGRAALRELLLFFGCRLLSGLFDMACMYVCVDLLQMPGLAAKILSNVIFIILNYLFSKFLIFQKK